MIKWSLRLGKMGCLLIIAVTIATFATFLFIGKNCNAEKTEREAESAEAAPKTEGQGPKLDVKEIRYCNQTIANIRTGPGRDYGTVGKIIKGERLYVLGEKDGWIQLRTTASDKGWSSWVKKDLTISQAEWEKADKKRFRVQLGKSIDRFKNTGLLRKLDCQHNEAYIDLPNWYELDYQGKELAAKTIAYFCGYERGDYINRVDIKDSYSKRRVAKYSEAWGFKTY